MSERLIRFGSGAIDALTEVLATLGVGRALLVTTERGARSPLGAPLAGTFEGVRPHVPLATVRAGAQRARELGADGLIALGGGSAIDTAKAIVAELACEPALPIVAVPTTYAGAEWTPYYGVLLAPGHKGGGADERCRPAAALYDPELTAGLPLHASVGTALNALAHCAEAYYHPASTEAAATSADRGGAALAEGLPRLVEEGDSLEVRTLLLEGAMHAALALADSGLCLGHAMAQGLGGRFGLPQGTMNALCLPVAIGFNEPVVPREVERFGRAIGAADAKAGARALAGLGRFGRLRDHGVPAEALPSVAREVSERGGAKANPRPAGPDEVAALLSEIW